jgi:hypothetical protein
MYKFVLVLYKQTGNYKYDLVQKLALLYSL